MTKQTTLVITVFCIAGFGAASFCGRPAYRRFKESRALTRAQNFLAAGDYSNASLSARLALRLNPTNVEACKIMVRLIKLVDPSQILPWQQRLADLAPSLENKLSLASTAIRIEPAPCPTAGDTLAALQPIANDCCAYHVLSAQLALKNNQLDTAENHFIEAVRLEPTNHLHELNLAVLRLHSFSQVATNANPSAGVTTSGATCQTSAAGNARFSLTTAIAPATVAGPRAVLERLTTNSNYASVALRSLIADALVRKDLAAADHYSTQLLAQADAELSDRLRHLTILHQQGSTRFHPFLRTAQDTAAANAHALYSIASWMTANGMADATLNWLTSLAPNLQSTMPIPLAVADALVAQADWHHLEELLETNHWGALDFVRLGCLCRAAREQNRSQAAAAHWRAALQQAGDRLEPLTWLLRLSQPSGQAPEPVLWRVVRGFPRERWAWLELQRLYSAARDTSGLNLLYSEWSICQPTNFVAKNNFAATSMLLKRNLPKAHQAARELYLQRPDDAVIASTYAYSLHLQGRTTEAVATLEKFPPTVLETPHLALYYGLLLAADSRANQAWQFLQLAQAAKLLPEEQILAREATAAAQGRQGQERWSN
jgi:Flp pilus assembly protein TadD